jgi:hypothetical protein
MSRRRKRKTQSRIPFAAYAALLFNASLCLAPFIGARVVSTAFGDSKPQFEATSEALQATRRAIDDRFERLADAGQGEPREVWADYVRKELEAGDVTTATGFLQAAPAMLRGPDSEALKARLAVSDGSADEAIIDAALAYLPEDVQEQYEKQSQSVISLFENQATPEAVQAAREQTDAKVEPAPLPSQLARQADEPAEKAEFRVLGDLRDLSLQAARWSRDDDIDEFAFTLAGVGLTLADAEAREGASILMSARRGKRLDPAFELYLEKKLFDAAPPQRLKRLLAGEFQSEFGYVTSGPAVVENVFKTSVDRGALESLLADLRIIRDIARDTSPASAVAILSQVKDGPDLRRARLVAQAGGDRAVALARYDGDHLLDTARTHIAWSNALRLQLAGLGACLVLALYLAFTVLVRSFTRANPKRRSAVYGLDEIQI